MRTNKSTTIREQATGMGWVIGVCVVLAVVALIVWPYFRPTPKRRATPVRVTPAPPTTSKAFNHTALPPRRVVVRAGSAVAATDNSLPIEPQRPTPATIPAPIVVQLHEVQAALAQELAALEELDFEHGLGAISDDDYAELQERTTLRINALHAQLAELAP